MKSIRGDFPGGPVARSSTAGGMDSILVGELRSHRPHSTAKKKQKKKKKSEIFLNTQTL